MITIDMAKTGDNIRHAMLQAGLTAGDMQQACGLTTPNMVWRWQKGKALPSIDNFVQIAAVCHCPIDALIART